MPEPKIDPQAAMRAALPEKAANKVPDAGAASTLAALDKIKAEAEAARKAVKEKGETSPAQTLKEVLEKGDGFTAEQADAAIEANIGTDIDPATHKKKLKAGTPGAPSGEEQRKIDADKWDKANREIIDSKGKIDIKKLRAGGEYEHIRKGFDALFDAGPLSFLGSTEREAVYIELLQDEIFLRELTEGGMKNVGERLTGAEAVVEAKRKAEETGAKFTAKETEKNTADQALQDALDRKREFDDTATAGTPGFRLAELKAKRLDFEISSRERELAQINARLSNPAAYATRAADEARQKVLEPELQDFRDEKTERKGLEDELAGLTPRIREARADKARLDGEFDAINADKHAADSAYSSSVLQRNKAENDWVTEKKNLARNAMGKVIDRNLEAVSNADVGRIEEEKKNATTELDKHMAAFVESRYFRDRDPSIKNSSRKEIKKDQAHRDIQTLLRQGGGADSFVRSALEEKYGYGDPRVEEQMKDPEFVGKWGTQMAEQAMGIYLRTGGKLSPQEGVFIESQPWGQGLIEKGLASNETIRNMEAKLKEKGLLKSGGFAEFLKRHKKSLAAGSLIILLLSIMSGGIWPGVVTGKEGAAGLLPHVQGILQTAQANIQAL